MDGVNHLKSAEMAQSMAAALLTFIAALAFSVSSGEGGSIQIVRSS